MQTKASIQFVPHKKDITIEKRLCHRCGKNCNRAFIIRFRGVLQGDLNLCGEEIGRINNAVNIANMDAIILIDSFADAPSMGPGIMTMGGKKIE